MKLSILIPAYNESDNIEATIKELLSITDNLANVDKVQITVVDDHSSDNTFDIVDHLHDARISCLRLSRRSGSHTAFRAGIRATNGDAILFISADGQEDPSCVPEMLEKCHKGANVVWALRRSRENESKRLRIPTLLFYRILKWFNCSEDNIVDLASADFWILDRKVADAINACPERNTSIFGLIVWLGFKQDFVQYDRRDRRYGKSKWNFGSRLHLVKDWIVAFSGIPLRIASSVGIFTALLGILYAIVVIVNKLFFGNQLPGYASIVVLVLVLSGVQLTILGIMGEYLWRNLEESRNRPLFFIEKRSDGSKMLN